MDVIEDSNSLNQADLLADKIIKFSRDTLLVNLRFLDAAIHQLIIQPEDELDTIATDGQYFFFNTWHILNNFQRQMEAITRDYLHVIFHCIFQHLFINKLVCQSCWDLACDIAVENAINDIGIQSLDTARQSKQMQVITQLKSSLRLMTAEKIYRYYLDKKTSEEELVNLRQNFYADNHTLWYVRPEKKGSTGERDQESTEVEPIQRSKGWGQSKHSRPTQELIDLWKQISERAQVDIETASKKWGDLGGGLHQGLNQLNREKYNYASFLKRFSVLGEAMQVNDEEFDLIFYTYGLKLYENMPLIEPLEYKEVKRIKEFVVAIDTSGSVSGQVVQAFVQKTYNILKQTENFFTKVNIHIIQCDAEIQEDYKITNPEEFDKYVQSMQLRGFGGTDFRPVFTYVDDLIKKREFENLRGLIYFTDGFGIYPTKKPLYDTAFVFLDEDYVDTPDVPPWAIKLVLSSDDVMEEGINL
ncbi:MAG TPA: VWA-like domain-containing protein [Bacteroidales bacterium]|jgi:predicted metal-dependent peptidase|nr:VWA-like domain-containing protein [Bacteroidales bacterium]